MFDMKIIMFAMRIIAEGTKRWHPYFLVFFCTFSVCALEKTEVQSPINVLRENISAAIKILEDPIYISEENSLLQRKELCSVAKNMFDIYAFSRLVLTKTWRKMNDRQQEDFVTTLSDFLCRYYLRELQSRYAGETVKFGEQVYKSDTLANVSGQLHWKNLEIPFTVRMVQRENRWRAYDIVVAGISAVIIYRTQFSDRLKHVNVDGLIDEIRSYSPNTQ